MRCEIILLNQHRKFRKIVIYLRKLNASFMKDMRKRLSRKEENSFAIHVYTLNRCMQTYALIKGSNKLNVKHNNVIEKFCLQLHSRDVCQYKSQKPKYFCITAQSCQSNISIQRLWNTFIKNAIRRSRL